MNTENNHNQNIKGSRIELPVESSMDPIVIAIMAYWKGIKQSAVAPKLSDWEWMEIPMAAIPYCGIVDVVDTDDTVDFIYRFWGTAHVQAHNMEMTGRSVHCLTPPAEAEQIFNQFAVCYERAEPCLFTTTIVNTEMSLTVIEHSLRLPFVGKDGEGIEHMFTYSFINSDDSIVKHVLRNVD